MVSFHSWLWTIPVDTIATGISNSPPYISRLSDVICGDPECPVKQSTMIQYVDDILIASNRSWGTSTELASLLDYLHKKGTQMQLSQSSKSLKASHISGSTSWCRKIDPFTQDRAASGKAIPPPTTIKTLLSAHFRNNSYCRPWIEDYASIAQPLYDLLKANGKDSDTFCMGRTSSQSF